MAKTKLCLFLVESFNRKNEARRTTVYAKTLAEMTEQTQQWREANAKAGYSRHQMTPMPMGFTLDTQVMPGIIEVEEQLV